MNSRNSYFILFYCKLLKKLKILLGRKSLFMFAWNNLLFFYSGLASFLAKQPSLTAKTFSSAVTVLPKPTWWSSWRWRKSSTSSSFPSTKLSELFGVFIKNIFFWLVPFGYFYFLFLTLASLTSTILYRLPQPLGYGKLFMA